jgi:hypothetical protein
MTLLNNLRRFGWSPLRCYGVGTESPSHEEIETLFRTDTTASGAVRPHDPRLTYRSSESGGTEQIIEPKESLELEHSKIKLGIVKDAATNMETSSQYYKVRNWCLALSNIAQSVNKTLGLPPNIFLVDDEESAHHSTSERLDLLRVFYYHAVPEDPEQHQLGSSPHTDWGSWTVVWQDTVGGLETYCRKCQRWIPVATTSPLHDKQLSLSDTWDCIIHVGDMSSLALGWGPSPQEEEDSNTLVVNNDEDAVDAEWPSPRHRVISPSQTQRTSLVYFAYPPASCSILKMQGALQLWNANNVRDRRLPLSEYYLLRDQSTSSSSSYDDGDDAGRKAKAIYEKLQSLTIREAIQEKWKQVQRD